MSKRFAKEANKAATELLVALGEIEESSQELVEPTARTPQLTRAAASLPPTATEEIVDRFILDTAALKQGRKMTLDGTALPAGGTSSSGNTPARQCAPKINLQASLPGAFAVEGIGGNASADEIQASLQFGDPGANNNVNLDDNPVSLPETQDAYHASLVMSLQFLKPAAEQNEPSQHELEEPFEAIPLPENKERSKWTQSKIFNFGFLVLLIVGIFLAVLFGAILRPKDDQDGWLVEPTNPNTNTLPFHDSLLQSTKNIIAADISSPQYKANAWMMQDPNLESYPLWRQLQRFTLAAQYYSTQGENWYHNDNWLSYQVSECDWWWQNSSGYASQCDDEGHIIVDDLHDNNLNGSIVLEYHIDTILYFDHSNNKLSGNLPPTKALRSAEVLVMSNNNLEGMIITYPGFEASRLRVLQFDGNRCRGKFLELFSLLTHENLENLDVSRNLFTGSIPAQLVTKSPNLTHLVAGNNQFTGTIPTELGLFAHLQQLSISGNSDMMGTIPSELGLISSLELLDVSGTSMTGTVPLELCAMNVTIKANCSQIQCC